MYWVLFNVLTLDCLTPDFESAQRPFLVRDDKGRPETFYFGLNKNVPSTSVDILSSGYDLIAECNIMVVICNKGFISFPLKKQEKQLTS